MAWQQTGNLKGPKGDTGATGDTGAKGDKGDVGARGEQGIQGIQGTQGVKGDTGADGRGIAIKGSVANYAALPNKTNTPTLAAGDAYLLVDTGKLYIWSGTAFPANGAGTDFRGPQGVQGEKGVQGEQGIQGVQGTKGDTGAAGAKGDKGDKGDTGSPGNAGTAGARGTKWFHGTGTPASVPGSVVGDYYLDDATGLYYELS